MKKNCQFDKQKILLKFSKKNSKKTFKSQQDANVLSLQNEIRDKIGLNVNIKNKKNHSGLITFEYKNLDQLNKIIEIVKKNY